VQAGTNGEQATDEVVTVVGAPATAADDDSDEELHPAD
jgi:hypothetical protein